MLGIADRKGFLRPGCDADLVVLDKRTGEVKQTWVAGKLAWSRK
jgi:N-acetylglucosamine-6-phosphate deacetylase